MIIQQLSGFKFSKICSFENTMVTFYILLLYYAATCLKYSSSYSNAKKYWLFFHSPRDEKVITSHINRL